MPKSESLPRFAEKKSEDARPSVEKFRNDLKWTPKGEPICWRCHKVGHKGTECPDNPRTNARKEGRANGVHLIAPMELPLQEEAEIHTVLGGKPCLIPVQMEHSEIEAVVDSGAGVSLIREEVLKLLGTYEKVPPKAACY
jgi:hypothetical protein